ncbi:MAG: hypothetical protein QM619_05700 [Micropruina sp.]|uniref:hypothetical protein n=1 Tax=Micropruina sp. TaxID=2737536 RepID=UPI0039E2F776
MVDFDSLTQLRGESLAALPQHVFDVLTPALAPEDEFQVGRLDLAAYQFVPFALSGLSSAMQTPDEGIRATTTVTVPITDDVGGSGRAERRVILYGPGDVLGVDPGQIVRRYPTPGSVTAEETFHAHIEFDRPELPWAFSAETPNDRMSQWLALVVLERAECEWEPMTAGLPPVLRVDADRLPDLNEQWGWAHAQTVAGTAALSARLSTAYSQVNVSRLIAARQLTQETSYVACLVPTTDAGVKAGLGLGPGTLAPAWTGGSGQVRLPVYDRWEFRTAPDGDFARLARRLVGVPAPWSIGRRFMDTMRPGAPLGDLAADEMGRRQVIRCALFSPSEPPPGSPSDAATWSPERVAALTAAVQRGALIEGAADVDPGVPSDLPIIGPRVYARGQRGRGTLGTGDWFTEINSTPVHRVVAGLGTRVVVKDQEPLMQAAWAQVGEINSANRALILAQFAEHLAIRIHDRLKALEASRILQITRPLATRMTIDGADLTLSGQTMRSSLAPAALGGGFRKTVRATGPIARRLSTADQARLAQLVAPGGAARDFTRPLGGIDGVGGLSQAARESLNPDLVGRALRVPAADAMMMVARHAGVVASSLSVATATTTPAMWQQPDSGFSPGAAIAERVVTSVTERVQAAGADPVRTRWLGGLAAGVSGAVDKRSQVASRMAEVAVTVHDRLARTMPERATRPGRVVVRPDTPTVGDLGRVRGGRGDGSSDNVRPVTGRRRGLRSRIDPDLLGPIIEFEPVRERPGRVVTRAEKLTAMDTAQGNALGVWVASAARVSALDLRDHIDSVVASVGVLDLAGTPARDAMAASADQVLARLDPTRTIVDATRARLSVGLARSSAWLAEQTIRPIMAAPRFDRPMYKALEDYDREWLVPGLGLFEEADMVTVLEANDTFVEAFLVGLSDEMARELLWREYPTDMRGTYFHRFWDGTKDELRSAIHRFTPTALGTHVGLGTPGRSGRAVIVIRGEVVQRYPDMTIVALKEKGRDADNRPLLPEDPKGPEDAAKSLFTAYISPDMMLIGLDITVDELREDGWWIVLGEHPQAPRFRFAESDVSGNQVRFAKPGARHGGEVAVARLTHPTRIAFEAGEFLPK